MRTDRKFRALQSTIIITFLISVNSIGIMEGQVTNTQLCSGSCSMLFDEGHDDYHPASDHSEVIDSINSEGVITSISNDAFDDTLLQDFDVLYINEPRTFYTSAEQSAVYNFVINGGGLFIAHDFNPGPSNELLDPFDLSINSFSGPPGVVPGVDLPITDLEPHQITSGLTLFYWNYGNALNIGSSDWTVLARYDGEPLLAVREAGAGRIAVIGDNDLFADSFNVPPENVELYTNIVLWLCEEPSELPVANAGTDQTVNEGDTVQFDGTGSYQPNGTIDTYEWDFDSQVDSNGDGNPVNDIDATGPTPTHIFGDDGVYEVTLKVKNTTSNITGVKENQDCVLLIDSSGSMIWNDPNNLRKLAAKNYVDRLTPDDRAAVVDFDTDAWLIPDGWPTGDHLSTDYATIKSNIDMIDSSGGTVIWLGLNLSNEELRNHGQFANHTGVIILLTDAEDLGRGDRENCYNEANISADRGIFIFTIGLNVDAPNEVQLLSDIANITGGKYFVAPDPSTLDEIYGEISDFIENVTVLSDTDTMQVTVNNVEPTVTSFGPFTVQEGSQTSVTFSVTDLGSDDLTFTLGWGDGTSDTVRTYYNHGIDPEPVFDPIANGIRSPGGIHPFIVTDTVSHTYGDDGGYSIILTVEDDDSGTTIIETHVSVVNVEPIIGTVTVHDTTQVPGMIEEWVARYEGPNSDIASDLVIDEFTGNLYVTGSSYGDGTYQDYATIAYDSDGNELWVARYDGSGNGQDEAKAIALDAQKNVYVTGTSYGGEPSEGGTSYDFVTIKYDSLGNELWIARYNGPENYSDSAVAMIVNSAGDIIVSGNSYNDGSNYDIVTVKYDNSGNEQWVATYDSPYNDHEGVSALTTDSQNNIYVTGYSYGGGTDKDIITIKYDPNGNIVWDRRYDGPGSDEDAASDIAVDSMGNVYVTGYVYQFSTRHDYITIKYNSTGYALWMRRYDGPGIGRDYANAIALDSNQNVYVTGRSYDPDSDFDYCTIKYDTNGYRLWIARFNGPGDFYDEAFDISVDSSQNVYVTGESFENNLSYDFATIAYDSNGDQLWMRYYNSEFRGDDCAFAMELDTSGNVYVTGMSHHEQYGNYDYATVKYTRPPDYECDEGSAITLSANTMDPGSDDLIFTWEWGDGTPDTVTTHYNDGTGPEPVYDPATNEIKSPGGEYPFTIIDTVGHTYGDDGDYIITLSVEDDDGDIFTYIATLTVNNVAPNINSITAPSGNEGSLITFYSTATDLGSDDLTFTWDWGDGTFLNTTTYYNDGIDPEPVYNSITNEVKSSWGTYPFSVTDTASHIYGDNGVYTVTLTVEDDDGGNAVITADVVVNNAAPTVTLVFSSSGNEGSELTFEAEATDSGSDDLTFTWEFEYGPSIENTYYNDGVSPEPFLNPATNEIKTPQGTYPFIAQGTVTHTYGDDHNYTLILTVSDDDGGTTTITTSIVVDNVAPSIIAINIPPDINEGSPAIFQANAADLGSDDLTFTWNFEFGPTITNIHYNDGTGPDPYPSPQGTYPFTVSDTVSHTYGDDGEFSVMLTVEDDDGGITTYTTTVEVNNIAPVIELDEPNPVDENSPFTLIGTATDPGSDDLTFIWDWGDGSSDTVTTYNNDPANPDPEQSPGGTFPFSVTDSVSHNYGDDGIFTVILTVEDDDGGVTVESTTITVNNVAPTIEPLVTYETDENQAVTLTAHATDPGSDDLTFTWDWGDGSSDTVTIYYNNGISPDLDPSPDINPMDITDTVTHTYGDDEDFQVTITVEDDDDDLDVRTTIVSVNNVLPSIDPEEPSNVDENSPITLTAIFTDPGSDDLTITWDWGDGFSSTITTTYFNDGIGPDPNPSPEINPVSVTESQTHTYGDNGVFTVTITALDDDNGETSSTVDVKVENMAPTIESIKAFMYANLTLRVAGEKHHSVGARFFEDGEEISSGIVTRTPGNPDEQTATFANVKIDMTKSYTVLVDYLPNDPRVNGNVWGGNPVWIDVEFEDGSTERLHHTFNVRQSDWDSDHWNHIDPWEVELVSYLCGHNITFEASASDPGSDDLTFLWDFGDGNTTGPNVYYNNGLNPDPYPSPEINPIIVIDSTKHKYSSQGTYIVTIYVSDDDLDLTTTSLVIKI